MEINEGYSKVIYSDLFSDKDWNAWNSLESFPFESFSGKEEIFNRMVGVEVILEGTHGATDVDDRLFEEYENLVEKVFGKLILKHELFLVVSERSIMKKNRIRSFKGILPKKEMVTKSFIEIEIPFEEDQSIIMGIVKITPDNLKACFNFFLDNSTCFVVSANQSLLNENKIDEILKDCFSHNNGSYIDYSKLFIKYGLRGNLIFRSGGDGGDQEVSLQCFCLKDQQEDLIKQFL